MSKITKLLFVALSDSQENYYNALCHHADVDGKVIRIKRFPHASYFAAIQWARSNPEKRNLFLNFKLRKEQSNNRSWLYIAFLKKLLSIEVGRFYIAFKQQLKQFSPDAIVVLNGAHYKQQAAIDLAQSYNIKTLYIELGCLPNTTALDAKGVNYNNSLPQNPDFYRQYDVDEDIALPTSLLVRRSVKVVSNNDKLPNKYIFVPFQVHDDTQILLQSPWIEDMQHFYETLESGLQYLDPEIAIVIKEHPSDKISFEKLHDKNRRIVFANANNTEDLIKQSCAVLTINSTVGIEALLLNKPVITLGNAFYNIEDLVNHVSNQSELNNLLENFLSLSTDKQLKQKFIAYLHQQYLVSGRPKDFDQKHVTDMVARVMHLVWK